MVDVGVIGALRCLPGPCARVCLALMSLAPACSEGGVRGGGGSVCVEVGVDGPERVSAFGVDGMCDVSRGGGGMGVMSHGDVVLAGSRFWE